MSAWGCTTPSSVVTISQLVVSLRVQYCTVCVCVCTCTCVCNAVHIVIADCCDVWCSVFVVSVHLY